MHKKLKERTIYILIWAASFTAIIIWFISVGTVGRRTHNFITLNEAIWTWAFTTLQTLPNGHIGMHYTFVNTDPWSCNKIVG